MAKRRLAQEVKQLRSKRKSLGITQSQMVKLSGVNRSTLAAIEAGYVTPNPDVARRLWDALAKIEEKRKPEISITESELLAQIAGLNKKIATCLALPWMRNLLPTAKEELARKTAQLEVLKQQGNLDDPIIRGLLDSLYKETEELRSYTQEVEKTTAEFMSVFASTAGVAALQFCKAVFEGDGEAKAIFDRYLATGKCDLRLHIDSIEKVEQE